jgi:hypothetical protein
VTAPKWQGASRPNLCNDVVQKRLLSETSRIMRWC